MPEGEVQRRPDVGFRPRSGQGALSWLGKLLGKNPSGPPIDSVEAIPARRSRINLASLNTPLPSLAERRDVVLRRHAVGDLTAEVYVPEGEGPFPPLVYLHGGAWCVWSAADVRRSAATIAARARRLVVNVDYRLAPEHPFPAALEDAVYAARWLASRGADVGARRGPVAIGGDSAGATLAAGAVACLSGERTAELDEGDLADVEVDFSALLLFCGVFDAAARMQERETTPGTTSIMANLAYLGPRFLSWHGNGLVSPARSSRLDRFPPTYVSCGSVDAALPQSLLMTEMLAEAGVPVSLSIVAGGDHECQLLMDAQPEIADEWERVYMWLDDAHRERS
jgi:acetyl esterase